MNEKYLPTVAAQPAALLPINSVQDMATLGDFLAKSNMFGKRNPAEGLAIVAMCQQKRISWLDFMQTFHLIQGVVAKKTDAILADFHRIGGRHRIVSRTPEKAEAVFTLGENSYPSSVSWEDCKSEPFIYVGQEKDVVPLIEQGAFNRLVVKSKYRTPRARMQMLWARCVSDGVRAVAPECVQGIYTPEETSDFVEVQTTPSAAPAPAVAPSVYGAQDAASFTALNDIEVCPCGSLMGKRWDSFDTPVLQQALNGTNPLISVEMKDYIRSVLAGREKSAVSAEPETATPETETGKEAVHA